MEKRLKNALYTGAKGRSHLFDLVIPDEFNGSVILFMHGYMGFKDWGCWALMEEFFVEKGYGFVRFNVTHNGTSVTNPKDFVDLKAFGMNSYPRELADLLAMIELVHFEAPDGSKICLMGHSRGGGMVLLAGHDERVSAVISLAGISSIERRFPVDDVLEEWKEQGVRYVHNGRTKQDLPLFYSQFEEFESNKAELNIEKACLEFKKPTLLFHGDEDESVPLSEGKELAEWLGVELQIVHHANHTFGASHPWKKTEMPLVLKEVCEKIHVFLS